MKAFTSLLCNLLANHIEPGTDEPGFSQGHSMHSRRKSCLCQIDIFSSGNLDGLLVDSWRVAVATQALGTIVGDGLIYEPEAVRTPQHFYVRMSAGPRHREQNVQDR